MGTSHGGTSAPELDCDVLEPDGEVLVAVRGELDIATLDELEDCLDDVIERDKDAFLHLVDTEFVDARSIQAIFRAARALAARGHRLTVATRSQLTQRLLTVAPGAPRIRVILV